jgi:hypothetical protein
MVLIEDSVCEQNIVRDLQRDLAIQRSVLSKGALPLVPYGNDIPKLNLAQRHGFCPELVSCSRLGCQASAKKFGWLPQQFSARSQTCNHALSS